MNPRLPNTLPSPIHPSHQFQGQWTPSITNQDLHSTPWHPNTPLWTPPNLANTPLQNTLGVPNPLSHRDYIIICSMFIGLFWWLSLLTQGRATVVTKFVIIIVERLLIISDNIHNTGLNRTIALYQTAIQVHWHLCREYYIFVDGLQLFHGYPFTIPSSSQGGSSGQQSPSPSIQGEGSSEHHETVNPYPWVSYLSFVAARYIKSDTNTKKTNSYYEDEENKWKCSAKECGHLEFKKKQRVESHIDTKHKGTRYPCDVCEKTYSRSDDLNTHKVCVVLEINGTFLSTYKNRI